MGLGLSAFRVKNNDELEKANQTFEDLKKILKGELTVDSTPVIDTEALYDTQGPRGTKDEYFIWAEGYAATGEHGDATLMNSEPIYAHSFNEAVLILKGRDSDPNLFRQHSDGSWTFWACHLFDNEYDARKSFG